MASSGIKVAVLLSGGVDSSLALHLLRGRGFEVTAFYLKIWLEDELSFLGDCPWEEDLRFCRALCEKEGVPLEIVPLQAEYHTAVVEHALSELRDGRTPSPDIMCNRHVKFGAFLDRVSHRFDKVASGHYAEVEESGDGFLLRRSPDPVKDQTYFLHSLDQRQLSRVLFPVGHLEKRQVREMAGEAGLPSMDRKDSQGICFLGKIDYRDFVRCRLGVRPGDIVEAESGRKLGEHEGYWFHTIGQRHGLRLGGGPWYVVGKNPQKDEVLVSRSESACGRAKSRFFVRDPHWILRRPESSRLQVKIRHSPALDGCEISDATDGMLEVRMDSPDPGIAPGQSAVFYDGAICLGGGIIFAAP